MEKRIGSLYFNSYLQYFSDTYNDALKGFSITEKKDLNDGLVEIISEFKKSPIDYTIIKKWQKTFRHKYKKRGIDSYFFLTTFFERESHRELDYQQKNAEKFKIEDPGLSDNFFNEEEHNYFLQRVEILLDIEDNLLIDGLPNAENGIASPYDPSQDDDPKEKGATVKQIALIFHYLNYNPRKGSINQTGEATNLARLVCFVNGNKGWRNIQGYLSNPLKTEGGDDSDIKKSETALKKNLQTIRPYFVDLGLKDIVNLIDKDLKGF